MAIRRNLIGPIPPVGDGNVVVFDGTGGYVVKDGGGGGGVAIAYTSQANIFTQNQRISKTRPEWQALDPAGTGIARFFQAVGDTWYATVNLSFDGTNWNLDDTSKAGGHLSMGIDGSLTVAVATAGANPRTLSVVITTDAAGNITQFGGQLKFPATQNPSSNVNTFDDYKEGDWTPVDQSGAGLALTVTSAKY